LLKANIKLIYAKVFFKGISMRAPPKIVILSIILITIIAMSSFLYIYVFSPKKVRIGYLQGD